MPPTPQTQADSGALLQHKTTNNRPPQSATAAPTLTLALTLNEKVMPNERIKLSDRRWAERITVRNCEECGWPEPCDCEPERSAGSLERVVRRWQWSWHRCKPFQVRVTWWGDKRLTVQKGFHVWIGWWRLSAVYLEMEAPNNESQPS